MEVKKVRNVRKVREVYRVMNMPEKGGERDKKLYLPSRVPFHILRRRYILNHVQVPESYRLLHRTNMLDHNKVFDEVLLAFETPLPVEHRLNLKLAASGLQVQTIQNVGSAPLFCK